MNFNVDDHGVMPFVGFNHNTYTAEGRGAVSIDGKVGKGLRLTNGSFLVIRGKFPTAQQPRTVSVWLKATQGKQEQGYALVYGDSRGNGQIFSIQIIRGSWCFSPTAALPRSTPMLPSTPRGTIIAWSTTERR